VSRPRSGGQILVDAPGVHGVDTAFCVPGESDLAGRAALLEPRVDPEAITTRASLSTLRARALASRQRS